MPQPYNDAINMALQVDIQPRKKLDWYIQQAVVKILNVILADEAVLILKNRRAHWAVNRAGLYDRDNLFDSQDKQLSEISNQLSRRIIELNGLPFGSFEEFLKNTRSDEQPGVVPDFLDLFSDHENVIRFLRLDAKKCSEEYGDDDTGSFLLGIKDQHEKMAWLLRSHIEPELTGDES